MYFSIKIQKKGQDHTIYSVLSMKIQKTDKNQQKLINVLEYKDIEKRLGSHNIYRIEYENIENWLESTKS